ncbi:hypothetical protein Trydic_g22479 [Trypoxylus dichotomus]
MRSVKIPSGGEIVVGQEYTDFDKGLDDGIEGDIYGFNLLLAAASSGVTPLTVPEKPPPLYLHQNDLGLRRQLHLQPLPSRPKRPLNIYRGSAPQFSSHAYDPNYDANLTPPKATGTEITTQTVDVPEVLSYFDKNVNIRQPKGIFGEIGKSVLNMFSVFEPEKPVHLKPPPVELNGIPQHQVGQLNYGFYYAPKHSSHNSHYSQQHELYSPSTLFTANSRILHHHQEVGDGLSSKPLGLILIELSYGNCALGKGSPVNDKRLLISWTKTPVRVFGGAILKSVAPFCTREAFRAR